MSECLHIYIYRFACLSLILFACVSACVFALVYLPHFLLLPSQCAQCTGPLINQCQACKAPTFFLLLNTTTCAPAENCSVGTFANQESQECNVCGANCVRCVYSNRTSQCLECSGATYLPADGICHPITPCGLGQYLSSPATVNRDNICRDLTPCSNRTEFQIAAPTGTSDRQCTSATQCNTSQYEGTALTATSDRRCAACSLCDRANETLFAPCNSLNDAVCQPLPLCDPNPCANNGTCINNQGWSTSCVCTWPFSGVICNVDNRSCFPTNP